MLPLLLAGWLVTAYDLDFACTGKYPSHKAWGITTSGRVTVEHHTIACPPSLPLGSVISIPSIGEYLLVCDDRGGKIKGRHVDLFMGTHEEALRFGRRRLEVNVLFINRGRK
jgi:3D (Asp-Asp-Asp) domain-containing protein